MTEKYGAREKKREKSHDDDIANIESIWKKIEKEWSARLKTAKLRHNTKQ
jgi:hypothetical protein